METDQAAASSENPDQASSDEQQAAGASPARSYECTFCKRGFSNAQALGGHMNIHRRDKAKLKQAASSSPADHKTTHHHHHHQRQPSLDNIVVPKNITIPSSYSPNHPTATEAAKYSSSRQELRLSGSPGKWPWVIQDHDAVDDHDNKRPDQLTHIHVGEIRQLPLFDEKPTTTDQNPVSSGARVEGGNEEGLSSGSDQVDLELRLGPERKDSSPTMTTKKFF